MILQATEKSGAVARTWKKTKVKMTAVKNFVQKQADRHGEKLGKAQNALGYIGVGITKLKQGNSDATWAGLLSFAKGAAEFLPPPASDITEAVSTIFEMFTGLQRCQLISNCLNNDQF